MSTFKDILALRGRILLFTPSAAVALPFEELALHYHAELVSTRGVADKFLPVARWKRVHESNEFGVFSADQRAYTSGVRLPCTDIVWVSNATMFDGFTWGNMVQAMERGTIDSPPRRWIMRLDGSGLRFDGEPEKKDEDEL